MSKNHDFLKKIVLLKNFSKIVSLNWFDMILLMIGINSQTKGRVIWYSFGGGVVLQESGMI